MSLTTSAIKTRILSGFDDPAITPANWSRLLSLGDTNAVNLTWQWQKNWWSTFGRGELLLVAAEQVGRLVAVAPLFADSGMIFNICPEDHLDFVGDISDPDVLDAILSAAIEQIPGFSGFRMYFVPDSSNTGVRLQQAAGRLGLSCHQEAVLPCPRLDTAAQPDTAQSCIRKKSLTRHERFFRREGHLEVDHCRHPEGILPHLEAFFDQHVARRAATPYPSLFVDSRQRDYYHRMVTNIGPTGWLRFTRIQWNDRPIAYHLGLSYRKRYLYGIPTFAIDLAHRSPGEVLLRQLILAAIEEGAEVFDFGPGGEPYKYRFATNDVQLVTWGLYPRGSAGAAE